MPVVCRSGGFTVLVKPYNIFNVVFVPKDDVLHYFSISNPRKCCEDIYSITPPYGRGRRDTFFGSYRLEVERIPLVTLDNIVLRKSSTHQWYSRGSVRRVNVWLDSKELLDRAVPIDKSYLARLRLRLPCYVYGLSIFGRTITVVWNNEVRSRWHYAGAVRSCRNVRVFLLYDYLPIIAEGGSPDGKI